MQVEAFDIFEGREPVLPTTTKVVTDNLPRKMDLVRKDPSPGLIIQVQAIKRHLDVLRQCLQLDNRDGLTYDLIDITQYTTDLIPVLTPKLETLLSGPGASEIEEHLCEGGYPLTTYDGQAKLFVTQEQYLTLNV